MAKFKLADTTMGTHEELWKMASTVVGSPSDEYPGGLTKDEFVKVYTCDDLPKYLFGYGKVVYDGKLYDFIWIRKKNQIGKVYYDEDPDGPIGRLKLESDSIHTVPQSENFTICVHPVDEESAIEIFNNCYKRYIK